MNFHDYIFKTLRWMPGLRPGPIMAVLHGLARVFNDVVKDMYWLRDQMNPATCELQFLEPLAESRGITRHRLEVDNDKFRQRVVKAFAWQLLGGKSAGMPKLLKHFGYEVDEPVNVRSEDEARWAEFKIKVDPQESGIKKDDLELLDWAINESKPGRSKLAAIQIPHMESAAAKVVGISRIGFLITGSLSGEVTTNAAPLAGAAIIRMSIPITGSLSSTDISASIEQIYAAGIVRFGFSITGAVE